jgi:tetratricopeptide (TPR) repeat protein
VQEPTTTDEVKALHDIRRTDPQRYLKIVDGWLKDNPDNHRAYFGRHFAWMDLGEPRKALEDMNKVVELNPDPIAYFSRAEVFRHLGEYEAALDDFERSERMIPEEWEDLGFGLLFQADCHARLGDEDKALACCDRLPEDFWTPGIFDAPGGDKTAVTPQLRLIAAEARRRRSEAGASRPASEDAGLGDDTKNRDAQRPP